VNLLDKALFMSTNSVKALHTVMSDTQCKNCGMFLELNFLSAQCLSLFNACLAMPKQFLYVVDFA